jgi:hypothetical membrane protein
VPFRESMDCWRTSRMVAVWQGAPMTADRNLGPKDSDLRWAGLLLFISGVEFLLMVMVGEATYPGYSVHANAISDLGATTAPTFPFYEPAVLLWGLLWLLGAYFYWRNRDERGWMLVSMLPGMGILLVGAFPENVSVAMHSVGSVIGIFAGVVVALCSYRWTGAPLRYLLLVLGLVSLLAAVVEFGSYGSALMERTLGPGGWERVIVYPLLIWEMAFGTYLLSVGRQAGVSDAARATHSLDG